MKKIIVIVETEVESSSIRGQVHYCRSICLVKPQQHPEIEKVIAGGGLSHSYSNSIEPQPKIAILNPLP